RVTSHFLTVFFEHQVVTQHQKVTVKGSYQRNSLHAPPFKDVVLFSNRHGLLMQAEELGKNVAEFCRRMLADNTADKLRPVRNVLQLYCDLTKIDWTMLVKEPLNTIQSD